MDPIADLISRIKNANERKHKFLHIPYSKIKESIVEILKKEGYIDKYKIEGKIPNKIIVVILKYKGSQSVISGIKRISKPGLRVYSTFQDLPRVLSGFGTAIVSTSKGIVTDIEARRARIGGEVLAYV